MNKATTSLLCAISVFAISANGQGTFQNLGFEDARVVFTDARFNHEIATSNALPGWSAFAGTNQLSVIGYGIGGFFPVVSLASQTNFGSLSGVFSVLLGGGSISQTGLLPADANSLMFKVQKLVLAGDFRVSLNDQVLSFIPMSNTPDYALYGADISAFSGQGATLKIIGSRVEIDDIQFSPAIIPEPAAGALLLAIGSLFASLCVRRTRRIKCGWP